MVGDMRSGSGRTAARGQRVPLALCVVLSAAVLALAGVASAQTWRGLTVAPEHRCSPYDRDDYPYPQSVERRIIERLGGRVYGPYTGRHYDSRRQTDIEHMVATSEAHDSGLCAAGSRTRAAFARDPGGEPLRGWGQVRLRRRPVAAREESMLVRGPYRQGQAQVPPHR